ncbi:MAG: hypothetical protein ACW990_00165 [Promethearchaeota archaeon]
MRKSSNGLIIVLGFFLSMFSFFPILSANGLTISHPPNLEILSNQGECFSDAEFWFQIGNNGLNNITVTPNAVVRYLANWTAYYIITFDKGNISLLAGESVRYHPTICNNVELGYGYQIQFTFEGRTETSGNVVTEGVGATVLNTVYSDDQGVRLRIRSVDQADRSITSFMRIYYGGREEKGQGWSIIESLNASSYDNVLLEGWYRVLAIESSIDDQWDNTFYLEEDTVLNVIFELLAFTDLQIVIPKFSNQTGSITYTLSNNYPSLINVLIHIYVIRENTELIFNSTSIKSTLDRGIYQDSLTIDTRWRTGTYYFVGEVWVNGRLFINQTSEQELVFAPSPEDQQLSMETLTGIVIVGFIVIISANLIYLSRNKIKTNLNEYKENRKVITEDAK